MPCREFHDSGVTYSAAISSACHLDVPQSSTQCTSDSQEQVLSSDNVADSGSSSKPGAAAATAAASLWPHATTAERDKLRFSVENFDVYFQIPSPGKAAQDPLELSDAAYKLAEVDEINKAKEMIKSVFTNLTIDLLVKMKVTKEKAEMLAHLVMDGKDVKINAVADAPYSTYDIYEFYRYWNEVHSYQCLLISAPGHGEQQQREDEMTNFCCQAFPPQHFDATRMNETISRREVSNSDEVKTFICDFFRRQDGIRAKYALHAMLIFFGHGSPQGFCAGQQHMSLDAITLLVQDEWRQAILEYPGQLPVKVEIIFTQCYGHQHSQVVQTDRFKVTALTTEEHPFTFSIRDENNRYVNLELTPVAQTLQQQVTETVDWRCSHNDEWHSTEDVTSEGAGGTDDRLPTT